MKHNFILLVALFGFLSNVIGQTYYIDSVDGLDSNNGTTTGTAWQSISKINSSLFSPGDEILFKSGQEFFGKLIPSSNGAVNTPITFGKYGGETRPTINGKNYLMCIDASEKEYLTFNDLILKNDANQDDSTPENGALTRRYGFYAHVKYSGIKQNIKLDNIKIHKIYPTNPSGTENSDSYKGYGVLFTSDGSGSSNYFEGLTIQNCEITDIGYVGISVNKWIPDVNPPTNPYQKDININNNNLHHIGGSGMVFFNVQNFLIENNTVTYTGDFSLDNRQHGRGSGFWSVRCKDGVLQKNEFSHVRGAADSCGAHIDIENDNIIVQYNLSYDNAGGFAEYMGANTNCIYRYNISINDGFRVKGEFSANGDTNTQPGKTIWFSNFTGFADETRVGSSNNHVYNNTIYVKSGMTARVVIGESTHDNTVKNNIFYVDGTVIFEEEDKSSTAETPGFNNLFDTNIWYGSGTFPNIANEIQNTNTAQNEIFNSDPLLVNKGGTNATDYKISTGSPAIDSGIFITNNGGFDYWSNSLPGSTNNDIGAQESNTNTWNGSSSTSWATAANWSRNDIPNSTDEVIISNVTNDPVIGATTGAEVNNLTIDSGAGASLTISSGGSLIVSGTSSGDVTYNRTLTYDADSNKSWHLVSSPISGENMTNMRANNSFLTNENSEISFAPYDNSLSTAAERWSYFTSSSSSSDALVDGKGYSTRLSTAGDISFTGTINTADVPINLTMGGVNGNNFNLLGNPFTASINSGTFLTSNTAELEQLEIYVWDEASEEYVTKTSHLAFKVSPGQGFFVEAKTTNSVTFSENIQSHETDDFQKYSRPEIKLNITDGSLARFANIYYIDGTTIGFDNGYDGKLFGGAPQTFALYTHLVSDNIGKKYQIQSLPNADLESMVIPVGINAAAGKEITFSAEALNLPSDIKVFLEDRNTNTFARLDEANSNYKITLTEDLNGIGRFYLHTKSSVLSTNDVMLDHISIYKTNNYTLKIVGLSQGIANLKLYNILGKQMMSASFESKGVENISLPRLATGVYIVQLETKTGTINKKIILN